MELGVSLTTLDAENPIPVEVHHKRNWREFISVSLETCDIGVPGRKRGRVRLSRVGSYRSPTAVRSDITKQSPCMARIAVSAPVRRDGGAAAAREPRATIDASDK